MYAKHPELAEKWQKHTPKGKKLPKKITDSDPKETMKKAADALYANQRIRQWAEKRAGWEDVPEAIADNPGWTGLSLGGTTALGIAGKRLLRGAAPSSLSRVHSSLRKAVEQGGLSPVIATKATSTKGAPTFMERVRGRVLAGGHKPIYTTTEGEILDRSVAQAKKGVTVGMDTGSRAEIHMGGGSTRGKRAKEITKAIENLQKRGKPGEASKHVGLQEHFAPGMSAGEMSRRGKFRKPGKDLDSQLDYLRKLQEGYKTLYGEKGYILKPSDMVASSGALPTHKQNWPALYKDYMTRLRPEIEALRKDIRANPKRYAGQHEMNIIARKFRDDPAYAGTALEHAMKSPNKALGQEMMDVVKYRSGKPAEYRVHMIGGEVPKELAYERYNNKREFMKRIPLVKHLRRSQYGTPEEAAEWARRNVAPSMRKDLKKGTYGLDIIRIRDPKSPNGYTYKLVELNPSDRSGASGFLDPTINPMASQDLHKWITGKDAPLISAGKKVTAVGGATGAGYGGAEMLD